MQARTALRLSLPLLAALLSLGCITITLPGGLPQPLVETKVYGEGDAKILLLQIEGVLTEEVPSTFFGPGEGMLARVREELDRARDDEDVRALLVRINSPGGSVTASDVLYQEISRFKRDRGVPVVAHLMGVAASGGYYIAMAADHVVAQPTTVTGSIGVLFGGVNLAGLMEKIGIEDQTLTTGPYKDAGSILRRMSPAEREQLQSVLHDMFERFLEVVDRGRPALDDEVIARAADGRVYSAQQALSLGLIDDVGSIEDAVVETRRRAGLESARVVTYHRPREYRKNLYSAASVEAPDFTNAWQPRWPALPAATFLYLWTPSQR